MDSYKNIFTLRTALLINSTKYYRIFSTIKSEKQCSDLLNKFIRYKFMLKWNIQHNQSSNKSAYFMWRERKAWSFQSIEGDPVWISMVVYMHMHPPLHSSSSTHTPFSLQFINILNLSPRFGSATPYLIK